MSNAFHRIIIRFIVVIAVMFAGFAPLSTARAALGEPVQAASTTG